MPGNLSVLYGGAPDEQGVLAFAGWLGAGLEARVEIRYARDPMSLLTGAQRDQYRNLLSLGGWNLAHEFLVGTSRTETTLEAEKCAADFRGQPESHHVEWGKPLDLSEDAAGVIASLAYRRDLLLADFHLGQGVRELLIRRGLLGTGTPLALISHAPVAASLEDSTVVVAWKPSPAARRVLGYGLDLLGRARQVYLVCIEETHECLVPTAQEMAEHLLEAHHVKAAALGLRASDRPAEQLRDFCAEAGADLLMMGAYTTPRLQEILFGGFTRRFLTGGDCNVLLAN